MHKNKSILLNKEQISNLILRLSHEIIESQKNVDSIAVVGIRTRGEIIAKRIIDNIYKNYKKKIDFGILDVTFYRDDFSENLGSQKLVLQISHLMLIIKILF